MKVVFYSTNTNIFDEEHVEFINFPSNCEQFFAFTQKFPDDEFYIVTQKPALFMPEEDPSHAQFESQNGRTFYAPQDFSPEQIAAKIAELSPDLAIAMTFWVAPFDWLTVSDALVAQELQKLGIKTICNPLQTALTCFDKNKTREFFLQNGFNAPRSLFVDHDMFFCAGSQKEVLRNIYRESVFCQIKQMQLPLVIKDTTGLSSYSLAVVNTYGEAFNYLTSKKNNSNRLVQEFAEGLQVGVEVYGTPGNYTVLPPFVFSTNKYGITSPKQSVKFCTALWGIKQSTSLDSLIKNLAEKLQFCGVAQIDLVYKDGKWTFIEINPRLSGMSRSYAAGLGCSLFELIYSPQQKVEMNPVLSLKLPPQEKNVLEKIFELNSSTPAPGSSNDSKLPANESQKISINQIYDSAAKQEREKGWCEVIITSKNVEEIASLLNMVKNLFENLSPELIELQKPDVSIFEQAELILKCPQIDE
ncbi:MAG: ATP-grasp domain-containing protein [Treponema sp.]|nr:ATP-grasp domain-containing protein [Treponema sp.]